MSPLHLIVLFSFLFLFGNCSQKEGEEGLEDHKIASVPEASGISYCHNSDTLVVANDEGSFYEMTPDGHILRHYKLGAYDFEGVVCNPKNFMFAIEHGALLQVDRATLQMQHFTLEKKKVYKLTKKDGIEGIEKINGTYYVTLQHKKKKDAKMLRLKLGDSYIKVKEIIYHRVIDSSGLAWHNGTLYILSDTKEKLYLYDLKHQTILRKIKLPHFAQEGVTFDDVGNIYFANDDGGIFKYSNKKLGL